MIFFLIFAGGFALGVVATVVAGIVALNWPERERERPPVTISMIGAGPPRTTGPESTFDFVSRRLR
jgi:hypothetical protein